MYVCMYVCTIHSVHIIQQISRSYARICSVTLHDLHPVIVNNFQNPTLYERKKKKK
ncbi:hypothetical protein BDV28DRAFT_136507, partial [Aspergillus coremiiformis]